MHAVKCREREREQERGEEGGRVGGGQDERKLGEVQEGRRMEHLESLWSWHLSRDQIGARSLVPTLQASAHLQHGDTRE